ncbi:MAG: hypothetical protein JW861_09710 [Bacteroidales bacterium]|nr:hypothetical protein [Bacteroidales bacterium]
MASSKDAEELEYVHLFRKIYSGFPRGRLLKSESPDFILQTGRRYAIGIEVTRMRYDEPDTYVWKQMDHILDIKEEKLPLYRKKRLDNYWLLMVAVPELAPDLNPLDQWGRHQVNTSFNRIFILDPKREKFWQIK